MKKVFAMKKSVSVIIIFLFLFSACKKEPLNEVIATQSHSESSTSSFFDDSTISYSDKTENITNPTQSTTKSLERYDDSPAADTLQFDVETLKALKKAAATMNDVEFESYLEKRRLELAWFEMVNTTEKFNSLLDDIENIYVAVLDENTHNIHLTYYVNEKRVFQSVPFSEMRRFAFDFYVDNEPFCYATMEGAEYIETVNINSVKADVYISETNSGFCADAVFNTQKFCIRVSEVQTTEEFEADLSWLTFVKIGDLLNE